MNDEARLWLQYARENLSVAHLALQNHIFNPCLQNAQQAVEKALKASIIEHGLTFKKTHQIYELKEELVKHEQHVDLTTEDCEFLDAIYLPSKNPIENVYPNSEANADLCRRAVEIAEKVIASIATSMEP